MSSCQDRDRLFQEPNHMTQQSYSAECLIQRFVSLCGITLTVLWVSLQTECHQKGWGRRKWWLGGVASRRRERIRRSTQVDTEMRCAWWRRGEDRNREGGGRCKERRSRKSQHQNKCEVWDVMPEKLELRETVEGWRIKTGGDGMSCDNRANNKLTTVRAKTLHIHMVTWSKGAERGSGNIDGCWRETQTKRHCWIWCIAASGHVYVDGDQNLSRYNTIQKPYIPKSQRRSKETTDTHKSAQQWV